MKIFNNYKSAECDRQIRDRRERNAWEGRIPGPSAALPLGTMIGRLAVPAGMGLKVCITDRSDYYHQLAVSSERSRANVVWPPFPLGKFLEFQAYKAYLQKAKTRQKVDRTVHGDELDGVRPMRFGLGHDEPVFGAFKAVLQGDHLGVEIGISAHAGLLQASGLLQDKGRLLSKKLIRSSPVYEGLVIDDYFAIAPAPVSSLEKRDEPSEARRCFDAAKKVYLREGLKGSDQKDIIDEHVATVVGAEIDSRPQNVQCGVLPVGAPASKRLALSWIAAMACRYPCTTDGLHSSLLGALVSSFCFRKCSMSVLVELFKVIPATELDVSRPKLRPLKSAAAEELALAAVLLPIIVSDVKMPFHSWLYATDASMAKGAVCVAPLAPPVQEPLWQAGDFRGGHVDLETWQHQLVRESARDDLEREELAEDHATATLAEEPQKTGATVSRPLAQYFDFIEVCGGSGVVSEAMHRRGFTVGPIIDISYSPQYDLVTWEVVEWLIFLITESSSEGHLFGASMYNLFSGCLSFGEVIRSSPGLQQKASESVVWEQACLCMFDPAPCGIEGGDFWSFGNSSQVQDGLVESLEVSVDFAWH